jgi:hypothetical protein
MTFTSDVRFRTQTAFFAAGAHTDFATPTVHRRYLPAAVAVCLSVFGLVGALAVPYHSLAAQALDSTGMPSLESLAMEAGRASRRHPIRSVAPALLCEPAHPLVDSASLAACAALTADRAAAITAAFARGVEVALGGTAEGDTAVAFPICPTDLDRVGGPRVLIARLTAPVAGVHDGRWEGRLTVELRCRSPAAGGDAVRILGKEYLYQWSGRGWEMYQHSWLRAGR